MLHLSTRSNCASCFLFCFCAYSLPFHPFLHLLRYKQKQMKEEMQRKIAHNKYEASIINVVRQPEKHVHLLACSLFLS
jgi:hypothetical protein